MRICPPIAQWPTMVMASAIDAEMTDGELLQTGEQINCIPLFEDYEPDKLATDAAADPFVGDGGVDAAIDQIRQPCPPACARRPARSPAKLSLRTDVERKCNGYCLTTAEITYHPRAALGTRLSIRTKRRIPLPDCRPRLIRLFPNCSDTDGKLSR